MDLDLGRRSIVEWAEEAPQGGGADFEPAKEKFVVEMRSIRQPKRAAPGRSK